MHCYGANEDDPWEIYWSCFSGDDVPFRLGLLGIEEENQVINVGIKPKMILLFSEILEILQKGYALHHLLHASDCLKQILSNLCLTIINDKRQDSSKSIIETTISQMIKSIDGLLKLE